MDDNKQMELRLRVPIVKNVDGKTYGVEINKMLVSYDVMSHYLSIKEKLCEIIDEIVEEFKKLEEDIEAHPDEYKQALL